MKLKSVRTSRGTLSSYVNCQEHMLAIDLEPL